MNIFVTDADTRSCAMALDDKRCVKMVLETAQMLSTVAGGPYKPTHKNHPCTLWVGESVSNYIWTLGLLENLLLEYRYRYNKNHKCSQLLSGFRHIPRLGHKGPTPWANCSGFDLGCIHQSYRECLNFKWLNDKRDPRWTRRGAPSWSLVQ